MIVPAAEPETSAVSVVSKGESPESGDTEKATASDGAGSATVNVKLVVSPVPPILGEPETHMVYVPARVVAAESAVRVKVEVQVRLGVQETGLNAAVTPVGRLPEAWLADRVIGEAAPLDLVTVIVLEPPVAPLTDVISPFWVRV